MAPRSPNLVRLSLIAFVAVTVASTTVPAGESLPTENSPKTSPKTSDQIAAEFAPLIDQLDAESFSEREEATEKLRSMVDARPETWQSLSSIENLTPEATFRLERVVRLLSADGARTYRFCDWNDKPLPKCWCSIYRVPQGTYQFTADLQLIGRMVTNDVGELRPPDAPQGERSAVVLHAPGYGTAGISVTRSGRYSLPLAKDGSKAAERSARGRILNADGAPIPNVIVFASTITTDFGAYNTLHEAAVLTDTDGKFRIYNPPVRVQNKVLPPDAKFRIRATHHDYFPHEQQHGTLEPMTISMQKGNAKHQFTFAGRAATKNGTYSVAFQSDAPNTERVSLPHEYLLSECALQYGTYHAHTNGAVFKPLTVTADSPTILDFEYVDAASYTGMIYDGITGEPIDGAIVIARNTSKEKHFVDITSEQWASLREVDPLEWRSHPTIVALNAVTDVSGFAKTDWTGQYTLSLDEPIKVYSLLTVAPGMLPYEVRALPKDESKAVERPIELNDMFHFAAATVSINPRLPKGAEDRVSIWPKWKVSDKDQPKWLKQFKAANSTKHGQSGFRPSRFWVPAGRTRVIQVPAGIKLDLLFTSTKEQDWAPFSLGNLQLKDGDFRDLGEIELTPTFPIRVRVVDHIARPVEGIGVRFRYETTGAWHIGKTTGDDGEVTLGIGGKLRGEFGVLRFRLKDGKLAENLKTPFFIDGESDKVFEIKLTESQTSELPGR